MSQVLCTRSVARFQDAIVEEHSPLRYLQLFSPVKNRSLKNDPLRGYHFNQDSVMIIFEGPMCYPAFECLFTLLLHGHHLSRYAVLPLYLVTDVAVRGRMPRLLHLIQV